jgi:hypothetical protein
MGFGRFGASMELAVKLIYAGLPHFPGFFPPVSYISLK